MKSYFKCPECLKEEIRICRNNEKNKQHCNYCGTLMEKTAKSTIYSLQIVDRTLGYYDVQLGEYIESSSHHRQIMKRKGVEGYSISESDSIKKHIHSRRKTKEQKFTEYKNIIKESAYKHNIPLKGVS